MNRASLSCRHYPLLCVGRCCRCEEIFKYPAFHSKHSSRLDHSECLPSDSKSKGCSLVCDDPPISQVSGVCDSQWIFSFAAHQGWAQGPLIDKLIAVSREDGHVHIKAIFLRVVLDVVVKGVPRHGIQRPQQCQE